MSISPPQRKSDGTKQKILQAVLDILEKDGFAALGVNKIARRAGVDKKLIYRYFDGFEGLLVAFAEDSGIWLKNELPIHKNNTDSLLKLSPCERLKKVVETLFVVSLEDVHAQEFFLWEVVGSNTLTDTFIKTREAWVVEFCKELDLDWERHNLAYLFACLSSITRYAGINCRYGRKSLPLGCGTAESRKRLKEVIDQMVEGFCAANGLE